jgi:hypothetical protein
MQKFTVTFPLPPRTSPPLYHNPLQPISHTQNVIFHPALNAHPRQTIENFDSAINNSMAPPEYIVSCLDYPILYTLNAIAAISNQYNTDSSRRSQWQHERRQYTSHVVRGF